jgi:hypothetical protein
MKPPILPEKRATTLCRNEPEVNPYALLSCNFESEFYDRDINMWRQPVTKKNSLVPSEQLSESHNSCHLSNFTYDKQLVAQQYNNLVKDGRAYSIEMGSLGCDSPLGQAKPPNLLLYTASFDQKEKLLNQESNSLKISLTKTKMKSLTRNSMAHLTNSAICEQDE